MEPESITRSEFEKGLGELREEFDAKLEKVQDRVLTAVFGFVNGASARMERLEHVDNASHNEIVDLGRRVEALEGHGPKARPKKPK